MGVYVVCVYRSGGDYDARYVEKLRESCYNFNIKNFFCLTDEWRTIKDALPLRTNYQGWWSKLELFLLPPQHTYFYLDLDTIINKDFTHFLTYPHKFSTLKGLSGTGKLASGIMAWSGDHSYLFHSFRDFMIKRYTPPRGMGDQDYINDYRRFEPEFLQDLFPNEIVSHKYDVEAVRKNATFICYHGRPRPHQTNWSI